MKGNVFFLFRQEEINTQEEKKIPAKPWKKVQTLPAFFLKTEKSCTTNSNRNVSYTK